MAETTGPLLEDDAGNRFAPAGPEARIACFVPSVTELLVDLGLADRLVARTPASASIRPTPWRAFPQSAAPRRSI